MSGVSIATGVIATDALGGGAGRGLQSPGTLAVSGTAVPLTGTTTETTLATIPIPAGTLGPNAQLQVWTLWSFTNSANNKILRVKVGSSNFTSITATTTLTAQLLTLVYNRGMTNSQIGFANFTTAQIGTSTSALNATAVDFSVAQNLLITGQLANTGENITLEAYGVIVYNP